MSNEQGTKSGSMLEDLRSDLPRVEVLGNYRVVIENHKGILEYDETVLRVKCVGGAVRVIGADLTLTGLTMDQLVVTGAIAAVEYQTGG